MESKYIFEKSSIGTSVGVADFNYRTGRSVLLDSRIPVAVEKSSSVVPAYAQAPVFYKFVMDGGSTAAGVKSERTSSSSKGSGRIFPDVEKVSVKPDLLHKLSKSHAHSSHQTDNINECNFSWPAFICLCFGSDRHRLTLMALLAFYMNARLWSKTWLFEGVYFTKHRKAFTGHYYSFKWRLILCVKFTEKKGGRDSQLQGLPPPPPWFQGGA